jgi:hypothetical protein
MSNNSLEKAKSNFGENNDVHRFYDRIIRLSTNAEDKLFPTKTFATNMAIYRNEEEYDQSFDAMRTFQSNYTDLQKKSFDVVLFHQKNLDGALSAYIYWLYKTEAGTLPSNVTWIGLRSDFRQRGNVSPSINYILPQLKDKNVLLLDLSYNKATHEKIAQVAKFYLVIDDHEDESLVDIPHHFVAHKHSTVGVTWKFFFPDEKVPYFLQYADSSDAALNLPYLPEINPFVISMYVRFVKNQKKEKIYLQEPELMFQDIQDMMSGSSVQGVNFMVVMGLMMSRFRENMKMEIAKQAAPATFAGYPVYILNFSQPGMTKVIAKHIASNHPDVPFAVVWHYDMRNKRYDITLSSDHDNTKKDKHVNLGDLAKKLTPSGGGHFHSAHLMLPGDLGAFSKLLGDRKVERRSYQQETEE